MKSPSEESFGARLRNAQNLLLIVQQLSNYQPIRPEDGMLQFQTLIDTIFTINSTVITNLQEYNEAVTIRRGIFKDNPDALKKQLSPIRKYVDALYFKNSLQSKQIATIINRIRSKQTKKVAITTNTFEDTISQSEQSYGSLTQGFADLVTTLKTFPNYAPNIEAFKISHLDNYVLQLTAINNKVINTLTSLRFARIERTNLYTDLHNRAQRIKSSVIATYGIRSAEYKMISKLFI
jgi:hypothetical protein